MTAVLSDDSLDLIFRSARTFNGWLDRPVDDARVRDVYDLMKWGPTSANSSPARFVWVRSTDGKAKLAGLAADLNKPKILAAPITVIVGHDLNFAGELPKLMPHAAEMMQKYFAPPDVAGATAMRNGTLQGAYLIVAARALGLDCGAPCPASTIWAWTRRSSRARGSSRTSSAALDTAIPLPSSRAIPA
jgi:3-hydroxypropanoate dehydrogenase